MRCSLIVLLLSLSAVSGAGAQAPADAYLDPAARELVRLARARRVLLDSRIQSYETLATERISAHMDAGIAQRLLYRRETAARIHWNRDTVRIEVLGAREVVPIAKAAPQLPSGLTSYMPALAFDPVDSEMLLRLDSTVIRHPLATGSEEHYRFASGDSTVIRLPDGRLVRLRELHIVPRRRDVHLITGSFWLDSESHAVVQAYFRLSRAYEQATPVLGMTRAELDYIAIDYGLWDFRWWLPRIVAAHGAVGQGLMRLSLTYERRYDDYTVIGDTLARAPTDSVLTMETRPCRPEVAFKVTVSSDERSQDVREQRVPRDTITPRDAPTRVDSVQLGTPPGDWPAKEVCGRPFIVTLLPDSLLMKYDGLSPDIYSSDSEVVTEDELRDIVERLRDLPVPDWQLERPTILMPWSGGGFHYNRVEGLVLGVESRFDMGVVAADAALRFGMADRSLGGHMGVNYRAERFDTRLALYKRLDVVDIASSPFSLGHTLGALLLGRDDNDYFRATGVELLVKPPLARTQWYDLRLFAEGQRAVAKETDFSLAHLLNDRNDFRENMPADRADQVGGTLRLRKSGGLDPGALRWATELELHGEAGKFEFVRPAVRAQLSRPIGSFSLGVEGAAGRSFGTAPVQRMWQIGGSSTLRGYGAAALSGEAFWRARAEIGMGFTAARVTLFGDAGWAGAADDLRGSSALRSVGMGLSLLDGMVRVDLARALDRDRGWRLHMRVNEIL